MIVAICDDEGRLRANLHKIIETRLQLLGVPYTINEYESGEELLAGMRQSVPQILFLDIEMSGLDGMETARELRKNYKDTVIIFVTAYADFVFQGYEVQAFHYILKPYKEQKIREVLDRALEEARLMEEQYYVVEQKSGTIRIPLREVIYFKSEGRTVDAVTKEQSIRFYGKLTDVEGELPTYFIRSHNRYLMNLNYIEKLENTGIQCCIGEVPVSRAHRQNLTIAFAKAMLR